MWRRSPVAVLLDGDAPAGDVELRWDGRDRHGRLLHSGIYLAQARAGPDRVVRRIAVLE